MTVRTKADRIAVVTGGASGIGRSICEHLARDGRHIGVLDLDGDAAARVADDLRATGAHAMAAEVDVSDRASVDASFDAVRTKLGPIEILVTSAATAPFARFDEIELVDWDRVMSVNLTGTFNCVQAGIHDMGAVSWGRIVTISSAAGQVGSLHQAHYAASKGGVIALTKTLALEYASRGITVNTIPPFSVDTPMLRAAESAGSVINAEAIAKMIPARRLGTPDDIAATCAFLCSDDASYITGQVIAVNGGAVR